MKKFAILCLSTLICVALLGGVAFAAKYKPGTYEGFAVGYNKKKHPGKILVKVTVDADSIKSIEFATFDQTLKGKQGEKTLKAKEQVPAQIIERQSLVVDTITKASLTTDGIALAVGEALHKATVKYKDGTYTGSAVGYNKKKHPGKIDVQVTIASGKISKIEFAAFEQTLKGKQGAAVLKAKDEVPAQIIAKQDLAVDSITKASLTSDGIKLAVARALEQAR